MEAAQFPTRVVRELLDPSLLSESAKALDVGCAVGGSSFELARHCGEVLGLDSSHKFISAASVLAEQGKLSVRIPVEGEITAPFVAQVPSDIQRRRVTFHVGNAMDLPTDLGTFDVVLAANILCRLPVPRAFMERLSTLVQGQLLLATPFSWLDEFTPKNAWLGGTEDFFGWETIKNVLSPYFELREEKNLPFLIREHARKFQYGISLGSRWVRRC